MFTRLVSNIRDAHVFSTVWTEVDWEKDLPTLERELIDAPDRAGMLLALCHLSNSLRDGHLKFTPCASAEGPNDRIVLPMAFAVAGSLEKPHFLLTQTERGSGVAPGDELITYDGVASAALLDHFRLELTGASPGVRLEILSNFLHGRYALGRHSLEGAAVALQIRHGAHVLRADPVFHLEELPVAASPVRSRCPARPRDLSSYGLVDVGAHVCLYRASQEPFTRYALVRQTSFRYAAHELPADHDRIQAFLAETPGLAGVLLDLRDNGGGNAADEFLDWYAPAPYEDAHEWLRLSPKLTDRARLLQALRSEATVDEYLRRAALGRGWWARTFDCGPAGCHDTQPTQSHLRVTTAPIALLLGA